MKPKRTEFIIVRLNPEEKKQLLKEAKRKELSLSKIIRLYLNPCLCEK